MAYVDGYVLPVPTLRRAEYEANAREFWEKVLKPGGALSCTQSWGDDVPEGKTTSLPLAVKLEPGETVVLSWVIWPDKETRDACYATEPPELSEMPFDAGRMIFGGFVPFVEEKG